MTSDSHSPSTGTNGPIQFVLVSGFLGAGKTTSLKAMGETLTRRGYTVGMITNDQAEGLVDTSILDDVGGEVEEIPGGCFCCNFDDLLNAAESIVARDADVLLCEPVGSCTDLVATVVNPLRSMYAAEFSVAPLTTVLDPDRVRSYVSDEDAALPEEVRYIFRQQVDEADLVVLNKTDTLSDDEADELVAGLEGRVGDRPVLPVSALEREGLDEWLSLVVDGVDLADVADIDASLDVDLDLDDGALAAEGRALTDIDYDTYAEGEARLGWVNMTIDIEGSLPTDRFRRVLMEQLQSTLDEHDIEAAHLKFSVAADGDLCHANLTATDGDPGYDGADLGTVEGAQLVLNARAVGDPDRIRGHAVDAVWVAAARTDVDVEVAGSQAFRPAYPEPVHRMDEGPDARTVEESE